MNHFFLLEQKSHDYFAVPDNDILKDTPSDFQDKQCFLGRSALIWGIFNSLVCSGVYRKAIYT